MTGSNGKFRVHPEQADEAMQILARYVAERVVVLDPESKNKIRSPNEAISMMDTLYKFKERLQKDVKTPIEAAYDNLRFNVVPNLMDAAGMPSVTLAGIGRVTLQDDIQVKVRDSAALHDWLVANDLEDIIKETVNAQTLAAQMRLRIKEGKATPTDQVDDTGTVTQAGSIEIKPLVRAVITRAGVK